jgi:hypothetical protein
MGQGSHRPEGRELTGKWHAQPGKTSNFRLIGSISGEEVVKDAL